MAGAFKKLVLSVEVTENERLYFINVCSDWALYCDAISGFNKLKVIKLMKYLVDERPKSRRLLERCVGRFNRLNALKRSELYD